MLSSTCVLRERSLCFVQDEEVQVLLENYKRKNYCSRAHGEMSDNLVIRGAKFWISKEKRLMGEVILPKVKGLEVRGRFTMMGVGNTAEVEVELMKLAGGEMAGFSFENGSAKYNMEVCDFSQKEVREKYLKTSKEREEPHYEIQIDVEVSRGKKELMDPQASKDKLVKDISKLLEDKGSSDMVIECQGELVHCHRAVLMARSATFAGGLGHDFVEKKKGKWKVEGFSLEAVRDMLSFIYTGDLPKGVELRASELVQLACFYQLLELLGTARQHLVSQINTDNAIKVLVELDKYSLDMEDGVKNKAVKFIKKNFQEVKKGKDWKEFVVSFNELLDDIILA